MQSKQRMDWTCVLALLISLQLHLTQCNEGKDCLVDYVLGNSSFHHCVHVCVHACAQSVVAYRLFLLCVGMPPFAAAVNVSLELQGDCSDQLTLICRHSDRDSDPLWIHNGTVESGQAIGTAFPGAVYTVLNLTLHTITITGTDNVRALDGHLIQCVFIVLGTPIKSNAVKYSFIPPGQSLHTCNKYWLYAS